MEGERARTLLIGALLPEFKVLYVVACTPEVSTHLFKPDECKSMTRTSRLQFHGRCTKACIRLHVGRGMESQLSPNARCQLDRFARQYFQLESDLDFPQESCLRNHAFQQALAVNLFKASLDRAPPQRYQLRVLKLLVEKIEQSIQDWDEQVCHLISNHLH